jgi:GMP synthase (glutamine-hydrolysing)
LHEETFTLPPGARQLGHSELTPVQAFSQGGHVLALQFHLEMNPEDVGTMVNAFRASLPPQLASELVAGSAVHSQTHERLLAQLLDATLAKSLNDLTE